MSHLGLSLENGGGEDQVGLGGDFQIEG